MNSGHHVAVVGATGAVGQEMLQVLQRRRFPVRELTLLASARSAGKQVRYGEEQLTVQEVRADAFGLRLVQAEYGHLAGSTGFFEKLPERGAAVARGVAHYLSTHPLGDERIALLRELADERGWSFHGELTPFAPASR